VLCYFIVRRVTLLQVLKFVVAHGDVFLSVLRERNMKPTLESLEELSLATAVICRAAVNGNHHTDTQQRTRLPSNKHHGSNDDCLEYKGENYQVCSAQYCVQQLCTVQCTHIRTDLTVVC